MLSEHPIDVILLAKDLTRSKDFYHGALGLEVLDENDTAIVYRSGTAQLKVTASTTGTADEQTQASWRVQDLRAELDWLKNRGVSPEEYDTDEVKTVDGIADQGTAFVAYIMDPDGNALGIEQLK
jgi:catechol-2,3-dioxygenase